MRSSVRRFRCFFLLASLLGVFVLVARTAGGQDKTSHAGAISKNALVDAGSAYAAGRDSQ
jgi:hypothetical protein